MTDDDASAAYRRCRQAEYILPKEEIPLFFDYNIIISIIRIEDDATTSVAVVVIFVAEEFEDDGGEDFGPANDDGVRRRRRRR